MKISTRLRYGTRLMIALGLYYDKGHIDLKDISRVEEISEKYLSQIIIPLKAAGFIRSFRGARGGYSLAKDPKEISLKDIYDVLEGSADLIACIGKPGECEQASECVTRHLWGDLGRTISNKLSSITVADLVKQRQEVASRAVMYNI